MLLGLGSFLRMHVETTPELCGFSASLCSQWCAGQRAAPESQGVRAAHAAEGCLLVSSGAVPNWSGAGPSRRRRGCSSSSYSGCLPRRRSLNGGSQAAGAGGREGAADRTAKESRRHRMWALLQCGGHVPPLRGCLGWQPVAGRPLPLLQPRTAAAPVVQHAVFTRISTAELSAFLPLHPAG